MNNIIDTLHVYLPQDRFRALTQNASLPDHTTGAALFADISGFTQLTETLRAWLGPRRGGEELTQHLGNVYSALLTEIERLGGSIINFAGDAVLCWFDESHGAASLRAVTCAGAMQKAMESFPLIALPDRTRITLGLKVGVATGTARRFVVGDPLINYFDVAAGETIARTSTAEHLAKKGDVIVDEATVNSLSQALPIDEWRTAESGERFAVLNNTAKRGLEVSFSPSQASPAIPPLLESELAKDLMKWIPRMLYEREQLGDQLFLTEFRPCAALFVRFVNIDFEAEDTNRQLDSLVRKCQETAIRHGGELMNLTTGDKGCYAYINFGALRAHEDDTRRAVRTALELRAKLKFQLQMGLTQGVMRVGTYGCATRKTFSALGDDVNLAARLMMIATPNEILLSGQAQKVVTHDFTFEPRPPVSMKGKAEPLPVFALTGENRQRAVRLQEPDYSLPMVGRERELRNITEKLDLAAGAKGQVIGIVAEAGMGKSRLVAEVIRSARKRGFAGYGGACQSDGISTPYLVWKSIVQAFFDIDSSAPLKKQLRHLESEIEDRVPQRINALPLLGIMLNLDIPDNDFTINLEPKHRQSVLRALLEDCLRVAAQDEPLLIVIEDLQWIDSLSHDLLDELARALSDCRICFVLAYRPPQLLPMQMPRPESMPNFTRIELHELAKAEAEQVIRAKLTQLYPSRTGRMPPALMNKLINRAQGNPFYLEELLNYLRDRGLDPMKMEALEKVELPDSLHALILSRLDQLSEHEKTTLRVACIVGRLFHAAWLNGYYPELGELCIVKNDLDRLAEMDITPLVSEKELTYLFKHIITHEVTYESLPFSIRALLHEQLAKFLERQIASGVMAEGSVLDSLVHHYLHSENRAKQIVYLRKAGAAALKASAFSSAIEYFSHLLELTPENDPERVTLDLQLAEAHYRLSNYSAAREVLEKAQVFAQTSTDRASALALLGEMTSELGNYAEAQAILAAAIPLARMSGDKLTLCRALYALGDVNWRLGKLDDAQTVLKESLTMARETGDVTRELFALNRLAAVYFPSDAVSAEQLLREAQTRALEVGNRERAMAALNNLGVMAGERKDYATQREFALQGLSFAREIGAQWSISAYLINLAECDIKLGELTAAHMKLCESLALAYRLGVLPLVIATIMYFARLAYAEGKLERALALFGLARNHPAWSSEDQHDLDDALAELALDPSAVDAGLAKGADLHWEETIQELLGGTLGP